MGRKHSKQIIGVGLLTLLVLLSAARPGAADSRTQLATTPVVWMSQESAAPDRARTFYSRLFYWPGLRPPDPLISPANSDDARRRLFAPQKTTGRPAFAPHSSGKETPQGSKRAGLPGC